MKAPLQLKVSQEPAKNAQLAGSTSQPSGEFRELLDAKYKQCVERMQRADLNAVPNPPSYWKWMQLVARRFESHLRSSGPKRL